MVKTWTVNEWNESDESMKAQGLNGRTLHVNSGGRHYDCKYLNITSQITFLLVRMNFPAGFCLFCH